MDTTLNYFEQMVQLQKLIIINKKKSKMYRRRALSYKKKSENIMLLFLNNSRHCERNRTIWTLFRTSKYWEEEVVKYTDAKFKQEFRVTRSTFQYLGVVLDCLQKQDTQLRESIPLQKRIAMALYTLASSCEYRTIGNLFGVGKSTVSTNLYEFCEAVVKIFGPIYINAYPPSQESIDTCVAGFQRVWGFPQCYGAVDGCHIEIQPEEADRTDYYNYKGWYSMVLLAACDYRYRFTYINIGAPGRNNDSYIFEKSSLKAEHQLNNIFYENKKIINGTEVPVLLLGDSAFKLSPYLMKPFPGVELPPDKKHFNYVLSRSRRVIENAFGHLKARFRKIGRGLEVSVDHAALIIKASCILHNLLKEKNDHVDNQWVTEIDRAREPTSSTTICDNHNNAVAIRNALTQHLFEQISGNEAVDGHYQ